MPVTNRRLTSFLRIELQDGDNQTFVPGGTIIGYVQRSAQIVSSSACVNVRLHGRAKSKLNEGRDSINSNNNNHVSDICRGRFNLVDDRKNVQKLFEGPLHIPPGGDPAVWPFVLTIPTHVDPETLCPPESRQDTFIPQDPANVAAHGLPPTCSGSDMGWGKYVEGFVEYFLKAELITISNGSSTTYESIMPITLTNTSPEPPISDFKLTCPRNMRLVSSHKLLPGRHGHELSTSERMKKFWGSRSVPTMSFGLEVEVPTVLQLHNPEPIPFRIRVVPNWSKTSEAIRELPQKVKLTYAEMHIVVVTSVIGEGTFRSHAASVEAEHPLQIPNMLKALEEEVEIPCTDTLPPVDIGKLIGLGLRAELAKSSWSPDSIRLNNSCSTYNVEQRHDLKWEVHCEIAGESVKAIGREALLILPVHSAEASGEPIQPGSHIYWPSKENEAWIQPPPEGDAPPSFTEVQKEDMMYDKR